MPLYVPNHDCTLCEYRYITHLRTGRVYHVLDWGPGWIELRRKQKNYAISTSGAFWHNWRVDDPAPRPAHDEPGNE